MISFTDPHSLERYEHALAAGLRCERISPLAYRVESESVPGRWYLVTLTDEGYDCNCPSTRGCKHGCRAAATRFPSLLTFWRVDAECREAEKECQEFWEKRRKDREESLAARIAELRLELEQVRIAAQRETDELAARFRRRQEEWEERRAKLLFYNERIAA
jgi:hypothetical protein